MNIIRDITSGALPISEIPAFLIYLAARSFWPIWWTGVVVFVLFLVFNHKG